MGSCGVVSLLRVRGQPKDGAILLSTSGYRVKCAVKLVGLPRADNTWTGVGTRHEAALQVASFLHQCLVLVRSDSGMIHILIHHGEGPKRLQAYEVVKSDSSPHLTHLSRPTSADSRTSSHPEYPASGTTGGQSSEVLNP